MKKAFNAKLVSIYEKYQDTNNPQQIDINGTLQYLEDLGFEPEDPKSLTLAYFLESPTMGVFNREAFLNNWTEVQAFNIEEMKEFLDKYQQSVVFNGDSENSLHFEKLYNFTFDFLMELETQRLLDYESALDYWKLLLPIVIEHSNPGVGGSVATRANQWYEFVETVHKRGFSKDSWSMFYIFFRDIVVPDPEHLGEYDEMAAWPSIIDEYVEYLRENELLK